MTSFGIQPLLVLVIVKRLECYLFSLNKNLTVERLPSNATEADRTHKVKKKHCIYLTLFEYRGKLLWEHFSTYDS